MHAVELQSVTKNFAQHRAVDDLSLQIPQSSIYGFIGPNGSGKTTTLRMILRIYRPDSGTVRVLGNDDGACADDRIGYLPEERGLYKQMKVGELLNFFATLKGQRKAKKQIDEWLNRFGIYDWKKKPVQSLSKGMAQRVQFIAATIAKPRLLILDEPFSGLDPLSVEQFREAILELHQAGCTIIFSTHDMGMAESLCDSVFMIHKGQKVLGGKLETIRQEWGQERVHLQCGLSQAELQSLPQIESIAPHQNGHEIKLQSTVDPQSFLQELVAQTTIHRFERVCPSLRDIFLSIAKPDSPSEAN